MIPSRVLVRHCVLAADKLGSAVLENFMDTAVCVDGKRTMRDLLVSDPALMSIQPPRHLRKKFSG